MGIPGSTTNLVAQIENQPGQESRDSGVFSIHLASGSSDSTGLAVRTWNSIRTPPRDHRKVRGMSPAMLTAARSGHCFVNSPEPYVSRGSHFSPLLTRSCQSRPSAYWSSQLDGPKILRSPVDQRFLGAPQRAGPVVGAVKSELLDLGTHNSGVLASLQVS